MAYNIPERYSDLTPAPKLDNKTLNKMVWMSCFLQASFNYKEDEACDGFGVCCQVFRRFIQTRMT